MKDNNISMEEVAKLIEELGRGMAVRTVSVQFGLPIREAKELVDSIISQKASKRDS